MCLELRVRLLHDAQIGIPVEHLRPLRHPLQDLRLDLLMRVLYPSLASSSFSTIHPTTISTAQNVRTLSAASRNSASVKLRDASSLCSLVPQFWDSAFAS